jgi:hypothetical protein
MITTSILEWYVLIATTLAVIATIKLLIHGDQLVRAERNNKKGKRHAK